MYMNKKFNRTGTVFEGRFKSSIVQHEKYFSYFIKKLNRSDFFSIIFEKDPELKIHERFWLNFYEIIYLLQLVLK